MCTARNGITSGQGVRAEQRFASLATEPNHSCSMPNVTCKDERGWSASLSTQREQGQQTSFWLLFCGRAHQEKDDALDGQVRQRPNEPQTQEHTQPQKNAPRFRAAKESEARQHRTHRPRMFQSNACCDLLRKVCATRTQKRRQKKGSDTPTINQRNAGARPACTGWSTG